MKAELAKKNFGVDETKFASPPLAVGLKGSDVVAAKADYLTSTRSYLDGFEWQ